MPSLLFSKILKVSLFTLVSIKNAINSSYWLLQKYFQAFKKFFKFSGLTLFFLLSYLGTFLKTVFFK